jgi:hypothetical protein
MAWRHYWMEKSGQVVSLKPLQLHHQEKGTPPPAPFNRGLCRPQRQCGYLEEKSLLPLPGFKSWNVHPVAQSLYSLLSPCSTAMRYCIWQSSQGTAHENWNWQYKTNVCVCNKKYINEKKRHYSTQQKGWHEVHFHPTFDVLTSYISCRWGLNTEKCDVLRNVTIHQSQHSCQG